MSISKEDDMPELMEEDSGDDDTEEEVEFNEVPCKDLFSDKVFPSARHCIQYCKEVHGFDIRVLVKRFSLDCFSYIRLINYIREEKPSSAFVMSLGSTHTWNQDCYLKPVVEDDPLLMFDVEEEFEDSTGTGNDESIDSKNGDLQSTIDELKAQIASKNEEMERLLADLDRMRVATQTLVDSASNSCNQDSTKSVCETRSISEDSAYAGSYSHFGIHHEMLSDRARTEAYRDAIKLNVNQICGKTVLDLGCGTGILSMFCAHLGKASTVIGVDMSDTIHYAMDIIRENKFEQSITLLKGRLEDLNLSSHISGGKIDVLVSEWMGYFLLFEGMLDSVLYARDRYLAEGGIILPNRCTMHIVGVCDEKRYQESVEFWTDVYGYKMSCMKKPSISEASIEIVPGSSLITNSSKIHEIDIATCTLQDTEFETKFQLVAERDGSLTAVAGYFDTFFDAEVLENKVTLPTGPLATPTHWKQTLFFLDQKLPLSKGQVIDGKIKITRPKSNVRGLKVVLTIDEKSQIYSIE